MKFSDLFQTTPTKKIAAEFKKGLASAKTGDFTIAFLTWKPLAEQGHADAQFSLGCIYENGEGILLQDQLEASKWHRLAAEQGHSDAQYHLGEIYWNYQGVVPSDPKEGIKWIRLAAEQGHAAAQANLAYRYRCSQGLTYDRQEAHKWIRLAAEQDNNSAQLQLGRMYEEGDGVPQNAKEAAKWIRLSAEQGNNSAQYHLSELYESGEGVAQDDAEAYAWFSVAVATDDPGDYEEWESHHLNVIRRDKLAKELTNSQRKNGKALAKRYLKLIKHRRSKRPWWRRMHAD